MEAELYEAPQRVRRKPLMAAAAYIDRLDFTVQSYSNANLRRLQKAHGHPIRPEFSFVEGGMKGAKASIQLSRFYVGQPQPETLHVMHEMMQAGYGRLRYFEAAFDFKSETLDAEEQERWLRDHVIYPYRRTDRITLVDLTTAYFNGQPSEGDGLPSRNLVMYRDRRSKLAEAGTNEASAHLEFRFDRQPGVRAALGPDCRIESIPDVLAASPARIFLANGYFTDFDAEQWRREYLRDRVHAERQALIDADRRMSIDVLQRRIERKMREVNQYNFVQRIREDFPRLEMKRRNSLVELPISWSWGASKSRQV